MTANPLHEWISELTEDAGAETATVPAERHDLVGWRLASFAADRLEYAEKSAVTTTTLWREYLDWCATSARAPMAPLAMAEFYAGMDEVAVAAGMGRRQNGGHVLYDGVAVKPKQVTP